MRVAYAALLLVFTILGCTSSDIDVAEDGGGEVAEETTPIEALTAQQFIAITDGRLDGLWVVRYTCPWEERSQKSDSVFRQLAENIPSAVAGFGDIVMNSTDAFAIAAIQGIQYFPAFRLYNGRAESVGPKAGLDLPFAAMRAVRPPQKYLYNETDEVENQVEAMRAWVLANVPTTYFDPHALALRKAVHVVYTLEDLERLARDTEEGKTIVLTTLKRKRHSEVLAAIASAGSRFGESVVLAVADSPSIVQHFESNPFVATAFEIDADTPRVAKWSRPVDSDSIDEVIGEALAHHSEESMLASVHQAHQLHADFLRSFLRSPLRSVDTHDVWTKEIVAPSHASAVFLLDSAHADFAGHFNVAKRYCAEELPHSDGDNSISCFWINSQQHPEVAVTLQGGKLGTTTAPSLPSLNFIFSKDGEKKMKRFRGDFASADISDFEDAIWAKHSPKPLKLKGNQKPAKSVPDKKLLDLPHITPFQFGSVADPQKALYVRDRMDAGGDTGIATLFSSEEPESTPDDEASDRARRKKRANKKSKSKKPVSKKKSAKKSDAKDEKKSTSAKDKGKPRKPTKSGKGKEKPAKKSEQKAKKPGGDDAARRRENRQKMKERMKEQRDQEAAKKMGEAFKQPSDRNAGESVDTRSLKKTADAPRNDDVPHDSDAVTVPPSKEVLEKKSAGPLATQDTAEDAADVVSHSTKEERGSVPDVSAAELRRLIKEPRRSPPVRRPSIPILPVGFRTKPMARSLMEPVLSRADKEKHDRQAAKKAKQEARFYAENGEEYVEVKDEI